MTITAGKPNNNEDMLLDMAAAIDSLAIRLGQYEVAEKVRETARYYFDNVIQTNNSGNEK